LTKEAIWDVVPADATKAPYGGCFISKRKSEGENETYDFQSQINMVERRPGLVVSFVAKTGWGVWPSLSKK